MSSDTPDEDCQRVLKIVTRLLEQTRAGKLVWEPATSSSYVYSSRSSSVTISCRDADDNYPYDVTVFNKRGAAVADIEFASGDASAENVAELYRMAGRVHLEVDRTLDALLSELEDESPF